MNDPTAPYAIAMTRVLSQIMREDRGRLIAALIARMGDFRLAEEALQEASIAALSHWGRNGLPSSPQGWLLKVAFRKAIDHLRAGGREEKRNDMLARLARDEAEDTEPDGIADERLRLIFTCCHPALSPKSQVALTLRTIGGLSTSQIARAFLDEEAAMGQRLSRAKAKISAAGIPFRVPDAEDLPARLSSVLNVVYLIFNAGYDHGPSLGADLCAEALYLARLLVHLMPKEPEVEGCLALLALTHARAGARHGEGGRAIPLTGQNRGLWDAGLYAEGLHLVEGALKRGRPGPFQIKAALAACHMAPEGPDWPQIAALYHVLLFYEDTPIVRLNHAVAVAEVDGPQAGLSLLEPLRDALSEYQPFFAAMADLLARDGRADESRAAYGQAIALCTNSADATFLIERRDSLPM